MTEGCDPDGPEAFEGTLMDGLEDEPPYGQHAYGYGSAEDEKFVRAWLRERERPGFAARHGKPYVDWEAWARGIRQGWINEEGRWSDPSVR